MLGFRRKAKAAEAGNFSKSRGRIEPALTIKISEGDAAPLDAALLVQIRRLYVHDDRRGFLDLADLPKLHFVGEAGHPAGRSRERTEVAAAIGAGDHEEENDTQQDDTHADHQSGGGERDSQTGNLCAPDRLVCGYLGFGSGMKGASSVSGTPDFKAREGGNSEQQK